MTKTLIAISAKARSGKDTVASYLWHNYGFTRIAFADPVKLAAQHMFGLTHDQTWNDALKETVIPFWGMSPRRMFQLLGTEASKPYFGDDIWIKRWQVTYNTLAETDHVVVPDCRFDLEADFIRSIGGVVVHLERPGVEPVQQHVSEAGIMKKAGDYILPNDGTLYDLYSNIDKMLVALGHGKDA